MRMRRAGFSLVEVMVALGVIAMLAGSVFAFALDLLRTRGRITDASRDAQVGAVIVERLEGDLLVAFAGADAEAGIRGDRWHVHVSGRTVAVPAAPGERIGPDAMASELRFEPGSGRLLARRHEARGEPGEMEVVSERVEHCRFRYFDGRRWIDSFDSASAGSLPVAIEVAAWFGAVEPPEPEAFGPAGVGDARQPAEPDVRAGEIAPERGATSPLGADPALPPEREPDLLRVMVVPDGPTAAWRESG